MNKRKLKQIQKTVASIKGLDNQLRAMSDIDLGGKAELFKQRLANGETTDDLLPEAFAVVREASKRTIGLRHFDGQLMGGILLHHGSIAEIGAGEGKTLTATLAAYLNALSGKGVHVVTLNDYFVERDATLMAKLYNFLGLSVGVVLGTMDYDTKRESYHADITYGTANQFGFDYLHDNLCFTLEERVQRELNFAIVEEIDSILIDDGRTPLVISGKGSDHSELITRINNIIPKLVKVENAGDPGDYSVDEKSKQAKLTKQGHETAEKLLTLDGLLNADESLNDVANLALVRRLYAGIKAHSIYRLEVDYIVQDGDIVIIDANGNAIPGRRWSQGLQGAIEAKEGVNIQHENPTIASITFQNYFHEYNKLAGMSSTAVIAASEFQSVYGLEVTVVPVRTPPIKDTSNLVFLTERDKFNGVAEDISECVQRRQPVLINTPSKEKSAYLAELLRQREIQFELIDTYEPEHHSHIISHGARPGTVTITTGLTGLGTDILLGGNLTDWIAQADTDAEQLSVHESWQKMRDDVVRVGGLHVIGTERNASPRIDNKLRGFSSRRGDPGSSQFYLSYEDEVMRVVTSKRYLTFIQKLGLAVEEGQFIEHPWVDRAIENAQYKLEEHNFDIRKQLLQYNEIDDNQRKVIYQQRNDLLQSESISESIAKMRRDVLDALYREYVPVKSKEKYWKIEELELALVSEFGVELPIKRWKNEEKKLNDSLIFDRILERIEQDYQSKAEILGKELIVRLEKEISLMILDRRWKEHLSAMSYLRDEISLLEKNTPKSRFRGFQEYATDVLNHSLKIAMIGKQVKPYSQYLQEFKRKSSEMFTAMLDAIKYETIQALTRVQIKSEEEVETSSDSVANTSFVEAQKETIDRPEELGVLSIDTMVDENISISVCDKVARNDTCPCGSGKQYKYCCGAIDRNNFEAREIENDTGTTAIPDLVNTQEETTDRPSESENITTGYATVDSPQNSSDDDENTDILPARNERKIGRNELCWCRSGKRFKQCHGKL